MRKRGRFREELQTWCADPRRGGLGMNPASRARGPDAAGATGKASQHGELFTLIVDGIDTYVFRRF